MAKKILSRVQVDVQPGAFETQDAFNHAAMTYLIDESYLISTVAGDPVIWVEVQYRDRQTGEWENWDVFGDAVEVDFTADPASIRTLTSEEWQEATK